MSSKIEQLLKAAIAQANKSDSPNFKVGAAAYRRGRIVAVGHNEYTKTSPHTTNRSRKIHAEFALSKLDLAGATVMVVRVTQGGKLRMARPCADCQKHLFAAKEIYYTDSASRVMTMDGRELGYATLELQLANFYPRFYV